MISPCLMLRSPIYTDALQVVKLKQGDIMKEFDELEMALRETKARKLMERADLRERVLRAMRQNPEMTQTEIRKRFGISHSLIKALISEAV